MSVPVIAVIGPTAVGKTALSIDLAKKIGGEVVSVDSRQVYRYMDVGTDKIDLKTRMEVLHHLIDVADPDQVFSVADFIRLAGEAVKRIVSRGRVPIFAGGTPFYYRAFFDRSINIDVPAHPKIREELYSLGDGEKGNWLRHSLLGEIDPESAKRIHPNDCVRVVRAIEIHRVTGKTPSQWRNDETSCDSPYRPLYLGLIRPRADLVESIAVRVRKQFYGGYPEEVEWLLSHGFSGELPSMKGFGYRELVLFVQGKMTLEEGIESDIVATRQFAKRQMTWFGKFSPVIWHDLSKKRYNEVLSNMVDLSVSHLHDGGSFL